MNPPFTSADYRGVVAGGGGRASRGRGRHLLGRHQHGAQTPRRRTCRAHRTLRAVNQLKKNNGPWNIFYNIPTLFSWSSWFVCCCRSLGGFLGGAISVLERLHRDILNSWLNLETGNVLIRWGQLSTHTVVRGQFQAWERLTSIVGVCPQFPETQTLSCLPLVETVGGVVVFPGSQLGIISKIDEDLLL